MASRNSDLSSNVGPPRKRSRITLWLTAEEQKLHTTQEKMVEKGNTLLKSLATKLDPLCIDLSGCVSYVVDAVVQFKPGEDSEILEPPIVQDALCNALAKQAYSLAKDCITLKIAIVTMRSPPSEFAKSWADEQKKFSDILCMRPTKRRGVPLTMLHDAFHRFRYAKMTFGESAQTISAARAASRLVHAMGNAFDDESHRTQEFNECIKPLFLWKMEVSVNPTSERYEGSIGASFTFDGFTVGAILREDKNEPGHSGDPYMQLARGYHMYVGQLKENTDSDAILPLAHGVPMFLLCVQGRDGLLVIHELMLYRTRVICRGGFYDGKVVTVEPLCTVWMLPSPKLQGELAQVLYTLRRGVEEVKKLFMLPNLGWLLSFHRSLSLAATPLIPSVPRLYTTCVKLDGTTGMPIPFQSASITFQSVFHPSWNKPIFHASLDGLGDVLAKMTDRAYDTKVHDFLARPGFAPKLHGVCILEGRPMIYVMEWLDRSWVTLAAWQGTVEYERRATVRAEIGERIDQILGLLEREGYVHGDLRASNIMVCKNSLKLKIVDFDWAGEAGQTNYPFDRNEDIKEWPSGSTPGGVISAGHDRDLVRNWWATFLV